MTTNQTGGFVLRTSEGYQAIPENPAPGAEERIASVIPLVVKLVGRFRRRLSPRLRGLIGADDAVQEAWLRLWERDHLYDPTKSSYATWTHMIVTQRLSDLLDKPRLGPLQESGEKIREPIDPTFGLDGDDVVTKAESARIAREKVLPALASLDDSAHFVLTTTHGIDREPMAPMAQAAWLLASLSRIIHIRTMGEKAMRDHILSRTG